jgi:UDP-N-acetylmuramoylalanine--D-glutamate ligase
MKDYRAYFQGKKITVMGLGLLGRGVGDTAFLAECGAELIVTDLKTETDLNESFNRLKDFSNITWRLGEHHEEDFVGRDIILKSAGVPNESKYIEVARKDGAEIAMSGALFARLSGIPIIGITGTRGKSTVTQMIYHVLTQVTDGAPVLLGGNVRGVSNMQLLNQVTEDSLAVMELDSWQLQGFGEYKISPQVAVFTNFMEDHMNYYHGDMDAYFADKAHIFMHQEESGVLVTTHEVFERAKEFAKKTYVTLGQEVRLVDASILPDDCLLSQPGEHNRLNAALATEALRAVGLTDEEIFEGLATFSGVEGRLEYLGEKEGIKIYNDNNATTPTATIAGITALVQDKNIILIAGGAYKEVDPAPLVPVIEKNCKKVFLLEGTGSDKIKDDVDAEVCASLREAVEGALAVGKRGDVLLFSPAFASFGMFKNEYDRNDQFVEIIQGML